MSTSLLAKGAKLGVLIGTSMSLTAGWVEPVQYLLTAGANLAKPLSILSYKNIFYDDSSVTEGVL